MADDFLGQILGSVLRGGAAPSLPGGLGGLGDVLGNMMGRGGAARDEGADAGSPFGGKGALIAMLLPLAMQWVQRNGGVGALLERFRQKGYSQQAASWVSTGENEAVSPAAVHEVVGMEELSRLSQQLGVPREEVASGLAQILPEVVNHLSPAGSVPHDADDVLSSGLSALEQMLGRR